MSSAGESGPFTVESAGRALADACRTAALDASEAVLLRLGSNAVYSLPSEQVIVRIGPSAAKLKGVERVVRVARWLEGEDFPATRLVSGLRQPVVVDSRTATFWVAAQDREEYASIPEFADLIRQLHWLTEPESLGLSTHDPLGGWDARLARLTAVPADDVAFLSQRFEELRKLYGRLDFVLPYGIIHGDANVGNAIRDRAGRAILIDLDDVALGEREWDLVLTAMYYERYGWHTREEYESFVFHYGFDVMNWPGYPVLADLRELLMVAWLGGKVNGEPEVYAEFAKRVRAVQTDGSRRDWRPL